MRLRFFPKRRYNGARSRRRDPRSQTPRADGFICFCFRSRPILASFTARFCGICEQSFLYEEITKSEGGNYGR